ncbi:hypothetical protein [Polaromonas sp. OV174]|uniref:hypothetical protein n=1 Tax=Polaromonas sp. OV174 TaxID=1855300 RepID=UPI00210076E0|nr:hypothetical protein [Polaromonas sp. OV174]
MFPVNPGIQRIQRIQEHPTFPSVTAIGQPVDVAVVAVPNKRAVDAFNDGAQAGVAWRGVVNKPEGQRLIAWRSRCSASSTVALGQPRLIRMKPCPS